MVVALRGAIGVCMHSPVDELQEARSTKGMVLGWVGRATGGAQPSSGEAQPSAPASGWQKVAGGEQGSKRSGRGRDQAWAGQMGMGRASGTLTEHYIQWHNWWDL